MDTSIMGQMWSQERNPEEDKQTYTVDFTDSTPPPSDVDVSSPGNDNNTATITDTDVSLEDHNLDNGRTTLDQSMSTISIADGSTTMNSNDTTCADRSEINHRTTSIDVHHHHHQQPDETVPCPIGQSEADSHPDCAIPERSRAAVGVIRSTNEATGRVNVNKSLELIWKTRVGDLARPCGMCFMKDGAHIAVADTDNKAIKVFQTDTGKVVDTIGSLLNSILGHKFDPYDVCCSANDSFVILSDLNANAIDEYNTDSSHRHRKTWKTGNLLAPRGIIRDAHDNWVIVDREAHCVCTFSSSHAKPRYFGSSVLHLPVFVATDRFGRYYVADEGHHQVAVFDHHGLVISRLGSRGSLDGQLLKPQGVAVDARGNLLVCDSLNDRVSVFSADGRFLRHLTCEEPILRPIGILVDNKNSTIAITQQYMQWNTLSLYNYL